MSKITLQHKMFNGQWGPVISRELFQRGEAAAVLLYDPQLDVVVLTEQIRIGALNYDSPWQFEIVAGMIEPGLTPEEVAIKEAKGQSMPKDNIDRAIKKSVAGEGDDYEEIRYEGYGPNGVAVIVDAAVKRFQNGCLVIVLDRDDEREAVFIGVGGVQFGELGALGIRQGVEARAGLFGGAFGGQGPAGFPPIPLVRAHRYRKRPGYRE